MARQERLAGDDPLGFVAVIEEGALDRMVGGPEVMRQQLKHLLDLERRPNVTLHVMPSSIAVHDGLDGEFMLLDFHEAQSIVYAEFQDGAVYVQDDLTRKRMCSRATSATEVVEARLGNLEA